MSEKIAVFVSDGIRYTLKGRVSVDTMKIIVDTMKINLLNILKCEEGISAEWIYLLFG